jgi:hypothetical protein
MQDEDEDTRPCMRTSTAAEHVAGGWLYFALLFLPLNSFFFLLVIMECFFFTVYFPFFSWIQGSEVGMEKNL